MDAKEGPAHGAYRPNITYMKQPTPEEIVGKMVALHSELANFQFYLSRQSVPPRFEGEDIEAIKTVSIAIEREVQRMQAYIKRKAMDTIVMDALKREGFEPDEPKA